MPKLSTNEQSAVETFKAKAREFWSVWKSLESKKETARSDPKIASEYGDLMERGKMIRSGVETITGLIDKAGRAYDSVKSWISEKFGLGGVELERHATLGVLPLIPIAAIGLSVAAMGKWLRDAYVLDRKLDAIVELQEKGMSARDASKAVSNVMDKGLFGTMSPIIPLALIAAVGVLVWNNRKRN